MQKNARLVGVCVGGGGESIHEGFLLHPFQSSILVDCNLLSQEKKKILQLRQI